MNDPTEQQKQNNNDNHDQNSIDSNSNSTSNTPDEPPAKKQKIDDHPTENIEPALSPTSQRASHRGLNKNEAHEERIKIRK